MVELISPSDNLKTLQAKMTEYMEEPEVKLGWLIDRKQKKVYIYRPSLPTECLENPESVSGIYSFQSPRNAYRMFRKS